MYKPVAMLAFLALSICVYALYTWNPDPDELDDAEDSRVPIASVSSYETALEVWKSPEDINGWIVNNFSYDTDRALHLSETRRNTDESVSIYTPSQVFETKTGICVDLARFSVESLKKIDPNSDPKYLMIEFDPIQIRGNTFRLHWLVSFRRDGKAYFFADSKRPGHIAGPYNGAQAFVDQYEQYRNRKIVAFRELASYRKQRRTKAVKRLATKKP